ncbi:MAG: LysM peptidoglycan-binding domain-containing M23 family metallopeptidase [Anaerolineae bacterium]|nr:LysM peptidoglycan-binding domain-containing M23 family metallopeptidase [Anaerolineae bacterium]
MEKDGVEGPVNGLLHALRGSIALLAAVAMVVVSAILILSFPTRPLIGLLPTPAPPTETPTPTQTPTPRPPLPTPSFDTLTDLAALPVAGQGSDPLTRAMEPFTLRPDRPRDEVLVYTVQPNDTLWTIAENFNIKMDTLFWSNREALPDVHMLRVGLNLNILPVDGVYHTANGNDTLQDIANRFSVDPYTIIDSPFNDLGDLGPDDAPSAGTRVVIPGGVDDYADWVWRPPAVEIATSGGPQINFAPGHPGSCGAVPTGLGGDGTFRSPLPWYYVGWTFQEWHRGIDLMAAEGTPVYAADPGIVIFAGWNTWGYGNLIVISHGNGWMTYYAHLSYLNVGCGSFVNAGQQIGEVGTTGRSSGPHLHFEIRQNGEPLNPQNFVGFANAE